MDAIQVSNLSKHYKDFAIDQISFRLPQGCIMGFIGENGAGKSTTIRLLLGLTQPDGGQSKLFGTPSESLSKAQRQQIGVVLDECCFPETLNALQASKFLCKLFENWDQAKYLMLCKQFELPLQKAVSQFSKGMKMKLSIAVALCHGAKLLILDEATSGLDPIVRDEILDLLLDFIQDETCSVFLSSHIISDLQKVCDYITFIHKGKLVLCEEKDILLQEYVMANLTQQNLEEIDPNAVLGVRKNAFGAQAVAHKKMLPTGVDTAPCSLEDMMLYLIKGEKQ